MNLVISLVISFDVDGTLDCGSPPGPIPLSLVEKIANQPGVAVGFTGGIGRLPKETPYASWRAGPCTKWRDAVDVVHRAESKALVLETRADLGRIRVHVGDEATDFIAALQAGWEAFLTPEEFMAIKSWTRP